MALFTNRTQIDTVNNKKDTIGIMDRKINVGWKIKIWKTKI